MLQREFFGDDLGEAGADFVGVGFARVTAEGVRAGEPLRVTDPDE